MKIKHLRLKNFAKFEDFEIIFNDGVTRLVGINGSGKTTVGLTAIWAGFKGIAEKSKTGQLIGERYRFIPDGEKSAKIEIKLHDEVANQDITLTRTITKKLNQIAIKTDGLECTKDYIENLFNITFLSAFASPALRKTNSRLKPNSKLKFLDNLITTSYLGFPI